MTFVNKNKIGITFAFLQLSLKEKKIEKHEIYISSLFSLIFFFYIMATEIVIMVSKPNFSSISAGKKLNEASSYLNCRSAQCACRICFILNFA